MALTPIDIQKMQFRKQLFGYDPGEVESFLLAASEELTSVLEEVEKLERENRYYKQRLHESQQRETQLQATLVEVQKVSEQITSNAKREGALIRQEAEAKAHQIVARAVEDVARIESRIQELRTARRELQHRFRHTLEFFQRLLQAEAEEEERRATIHPLPRPRPASEPGSQEHG